MNKITHIQTYMYCYGDCEPFVAIHRGGSDRVRFYTLTKASAWRLASAIPYGKGRYGVDGQGWSWIREEVE